MPKILLVEDNEMNRDMLSRRLIRRGYEVVIAVDGQQGVDLAGSIAPNLILMDMRASPVIEPDGRRPAASRPPRPPRVHSTSIALTAHAMAGDREQAMAAGCDDYDTKPIDLARLLPKIERFAGPGSAPAA